MMKLEKMDDFFAARIDGYDEHMKRDILPASMPIPLPCCLWRAEAGCWISAAAPVLSWRNTLC